MKIQKATAADFLDTRLSKSLPGACNCVMKVSEQESISEWDDEERHSVTGNAWANNFLAVRPGRIFGTDQRLRYLGHSSALVGGKSLPHYLPLVGLYGKPVGRSASCPAPATTTTQQEKHRGRRARAVFALCFAKTVQLSCYLRSLRRKLLPLLSVSTRNSALLLEGVHPRGSQRNYSKTAG